MADSTIWDLAAESVMLATHRLPVQDTGTGTAAQHATFALLGGMEHVAASVTTGNVTGLVGTFHWLDVSGMTADRDFLLPDAANIGELCGVGISVGEIGAAEDLLVKTTDDTSKINNNDGNYNTNAYRALGTAGQIMLFRCVTASATSPDWVVLHQEPAIKSNHIRGMLYSFTSTSTVTVATGEIMINGKLFRHPSTTVVTQSATTGADIVYFLYAIISSGVLAFEFSTTRGTYNESLGYFIQGTDKDKRRIGHVSENSSDNIRDFRTFVVGGDENNIQHFKANNEQLLFLTAGNSTDITTPIAGNIGAWELAIGDDCDFLIVQLALGRNANTGGVAFGLAINDITYSSVGNMAYVMAFFDTQATINTFSVLILIENPGVGNDVLYAVDNAEVDAFVIYQGAQFRR